MFLANAAVYSCLGSLSILSLFIGIAVAHAWTKRSPVHVLAALLLISFGLFLIWGNTEGITVFFSPAKPKSTWVMIASASVLLAFLGFEIAEHSMDHRSKQV